MKLNQNNINGKKKKNDENNSYFKNYNKERTNENLIINKIYSYKTKNISTINNKSNNNNTSNLSHSKNDANNNSRRIHGQQSLQNININRNNTTENNFIYTRRVSKNKKQDKIRLVKNNNPRICICNIILSKPLNNTNQVNPVNSVNLVNSVQRTNNFNNTGFHLISQTKNDIKTNYRNQSVNPTTSSNIHKNHSTVYISHLNKSTSDNLSCTTNTLNKSSSKNFNSNTLKILPRVNIRKANNMNNMYSDSINHHQKCQTSRAYITKDKYDNLLNNSTNDKKVYINNDINKNKFSRRLEITEKTEVLMPNQTFKPIEIIEKKEGPIIEIKKNKDGNSTKIIKENLIKITIEKSIINDPKVNIVKNGQKVNMIKQKTTKEYLTKIKSCHDILNENNSREKRNELIYTDKRRLNQTQEIKNKLQQNISQKVIYKNNDNNKLNSFEVGKIDDSLSINTDKEIKNYHIKLVSYNNPKDSLMNDDDLDKKNKTTYNFKFRRGNDNKKNVDSNNKNKSKNNFYKIINIQKHNISNGDMNSNNYILKSNSLFQNNKSQNVSYRKLNRNSDTITDTQNNTNNNNDGGNNISRNNSKNLILKRLNYEINNNNKNRNKITRINKIKFYNSQNQYISSVNLNNNNEKNSGKNISKKIIKSNNNDNSKKIKSLLIRNKIMQENNNIIQKLNKNKINNKNRINNRNSEIIKSYVNKRSDYIKGNRTHELDINTHQIITNESQPILNIFKNNNPNNTFNSSNQIKIKFPNKNIFDMPTINVDLDKNDSEDSKEEEKNKKIKKITKIDINKHISDNIQNQKSTKLDKLADFINKLNEEEVAESEKNDFNNDVHERLISEIKLPSEFNNNNQNNEQIENINFNKIECHNFNSNENKTDSMINIISNIENNNKNENNEENNLEKKSNSLMFMSGSKMGKSINIKNETNGNNNENKNENENSNILFISSNIEKNSNIKNEEVGDSKNNEENKSGSVIYINSNFDKNVNNLENRTESIMNQFTNMIKSENMNNIENKTESIMYLNSVFDKNIHNRNTYENNIENNFENKTESVMNRIKSDNMNNNMENKTESIMFLNSVFDKNIHNKNIFENNVENNFENKTESIMNQMTNRIKSDNMNNIENKTESIMYLNSVFDKNIHTRNEIENNIEKASSIKNRTSSIMYLNSIFDKNIHIKKDNDNNMENNNENRTSSIMYLNSNFDKNIHLKIENENNLENITESIMYLNSNFDKNIHMKNNIENNNESIMDINSNIDKNIENNYNKNLSFINENIIDKSGSIIYLNSNIDKNTNIKNEKQESNHGLEISEIEIDPPNNDQDFIGNLDIINNINSEKNVEEKKEVEFVYKNNKEEEEKEYEQDKEKFCEPLNKYENKFDLEQINPF